jgi:hypothetical protein
VAEVASSTLARRSTSPAISSACKGGGVEWGAGGKM